MILVKKSKFEIGNGRSLSCTAKTSRTEEDELSQIIKTEEHSSFSSLGFSMDYIPHEISQVE